MKTDSTYYWIADLLGTGIRLANKVLAKDARDAMASVKVDLAGSPGKWRVMLSGPHGALEFENIEIKEVEHGRS